MKVERREQRAAAVAGGGGDGGADGGREGAGGGGRSGEFKVGEGSGGEMKRAEYSAAVSRLADSAYSCSECATRGRQKNGVKELNSAGMQPCMHTCTRAASLCK